MVSDRRRRLPRYSGHRREVVDEVVGLPYQAVFSSSKLTPNVNPRISTMYRRSCDFLRGSSWENDEPLGNHGSCFRASFWIDTGALFR
jgi:hypothetical protein